MAADGTSIKNDIDSNLANKGYRGIRISVVITIFKAVVDWVTTVINGNLSTWLKPGTNQPSTLNSETVYRTGKTIFGRTTDDGQAGVSLLVDAGKIRSYKGVHALTSQTTTASLASQSFTDGLEALQLQAGISAGAVWMAWHIPGIRIDLIGLDTDGTFKMRPFNSPNTYPLLFNDYHGMIRLLATLANKKVVLFDSTGNDHQFMGFGVNSGLMRYQVADSANDHAFYAATSPTTSTELMRIKGNGSVGIGIGPNPKNGLEIGKGWFSQVANNGGVTPGSSQGVSLGWNYSAGGGESNIVFGTGTVGTAWLSFASSNSTNYTEHMRLTHAGNLYFGAAGNGVAGSARIHIAGAAGHQQLRMETAYTPTSTADANGAVGSICWDTNYLYWKTSAGWKRSSIGSTF